MNFLRTLLLTILIVIVFLTIDAIEQLILKHKKVSSKNQIQFLRLQKDYLNKCSIEDIEDLQLFLNKYIKERKRK